MTIKKPSNKKRLGRPLLDLLGSANQSHQILMRQDFKAAELSNLRLEVIAPNVNQPRQSIKEFELETLAESIKQQGVLQPILVSKLSNERYEIIAGERRWRAAKLAGLKVLPCIVKQVSAEHASAIALIENIQRQDLNPMDEAQAYDRLAKVHKLTHLQVAEAVGKPRSVISNQLRLLQLNDEVKRMIQDQKIDLGHAKVLLGLKGHVQTVLAGEIVSKAWSVRQAEAWIIKQQESKTTEKFNTQTIDPNISSLQSKLSDTLGAKVLFKHHPKGRGKLIINYNNLEELEGILDHIN